MVKVGFNSFILKLSTNIKATNICIKSKETKARSQDLKNHSEELVTSERKAKGLINTSIWIIIYLKEKENKMLSRP